MFRKILHIKLALFLLVSTAGINLSLHYCGGKLASIAVNREAKSCCGTSNCCHTKNFSFQIHENFDSPEYVQADKVLDHELLFPVSTINKTFVSPSGKPAFAIYADSSPPKLRATRLSLLNSFRC